MAAPQTGPPLPFRPLAFGAIYRNNEGCPAPCRACFCPEPAMAPAISPLAPKTMPHLPEVAGVRLATAEAGIRYKGRTDVLLAVFDRGSAVAGVFTRSKCPSAPVEWCRGRLADGTARALVVNSGNANAFTGKSGREACQFTAKLAAQAVGSTPAEIFLASTGV